MSKEIKENSTITEESEDKKIEEATQEQTEKNTEEKAEEQTDKKTDEKDANEDILGELALDKEEKRAEKQAKKEAKKAEKQAKKEEKRKKKESLEEQEDTSEEKADEAEENDGSEKKTKKKKKKKKTVKKEKNPEDINIVSELLNLIIYIGIVVLICYFVINFVGCRSRVDGDSMNPTLSDADNLWVDKLSYTFGEPERFDVIIFNYNEDTTYVKRIIGLPGESVRIDVDGSIYIDGQLLVESYGNEVITPDNIGRASNDVVLGEDEYFVLGDNRNHSSDSRWPDVGNVHKDDILGKVLLRIYPFTSFGTIK